MRAQSPDPSADEGGFITSAFAGTGLAMILVATAFLLVARQDLATARRETARLSERLRLEGLTASAALSVLDASASTSRSWRAGATTTLMAEPEARKIGLISASRAENLAVLSRLVAPSEAADVARQLVAVSESSSRSMRRGEIANLSADPRWRRCATSVLSAYSHQTALTGSVASRESKPQGGRDGEVWRILATGADGAFVDQVVHFSTSSARPIAVLEQSAGDTGGAARAACGDLLEPTEADHVQG